MNSTTSLQSAYEAMSAAVTVLRATYNDNLKSGAQPDRAVAQHHLAWLVPLHRALRAYLNNQHPGSRGRYLTGYYAYVEKYQRVVAYLSGRISLEGVARLQRELHPHVLALAIPVPVPRDRTLTVGTTVTLFLDAHVAHMAINRQMYLESSNRFLSSLSATQLENLREVMKLSSYVPGHAKEVAIFRLKDIAHR